MEKLCCSCGMCEGLCPVHAITLTLDSNGYFRPVISPEHCILCGTCVKFCPGKQYFKERKGILKENDKCIVGYTENKKLRLDAASGGITTELLCYLQREKIVDYCTIVPQVKTEQVVHCEVTNQLQKIMDGKGSKYIPVSLGNVLDMVKKSGKRFAIVGMPCQIQVLRRYISDTEKHVFIALFCNHCSSYHATQYILKNFRKEKILEVRHRGNGWPGSMVIETPEKKINLPFRSIYLKTFGRYFYNRRCRLCNDPIGEFADISMADAFVYGENENKEGQTLCIVRNERLRRIILEIKDKGLINFSEFDDWNKLEDSFKGQFGRELEVQKNIQSLLSFPGNHFSVPENSQKLLTGEVKAHLRDRLRLIKEMLLCHLFGRYKCLWNYLYWKAGHRKEEKILKK